MFYVYKVFTYKISINYDWVGSTTSIECIFFCFVSKIVVQSNLCFYFWNNLFSWHHFISHERRICHMYIYTFRSSSINTIYLEVVQRTEVYNLTFYWYNQRGHHHIYPWTKQTGQYQRQIWYQRDYHYLSDAITG